jgi:hypothetical protein
MRRSPFRSGCQLIHRLQTDVATSNGRCHSSVPGNRPRLGAAGDGGLGWMRPSWPSTALAGRGAPGTHRAFRLHGRHWSAARWEGRQPSASPGPKLCWLAERQVARPPPQGGNPLTCSRRLSKSRPGPARPRSCCRLFRESLDDVLKGDADPLLPPRGTLVLSVCRCQYGQHCVGRARQLNTTS